MKNVILIKHPKNWGLEEKIIRKLANRALVNSGYGENTELSIYFIGRKKAKELNMKYRKKDYIPQVLGFPMSKKADVDGYIRLGDVVICTQKLKYEIKYLDNKERLQSVPYNKNISYDKKMKEILSEWIIHGVENLLK